MFVSRLLSHDPARPALREASGEWVSYGALRHRAEGVAGWLWAEGVRPGDRVGIHLHNGLDLVDAHLGCVALGVVRVPLNAHYLEGELAPILEDANPTLVITGSPERFAGRRCASAPGSGLLPVPAWPAHDVTAYLFTSGTTGRPKAAPQTWAMWEANLDALAALWGLTQADCLWLALPMFHTHGLVLGLHGTLLRGSRAIIGAKFEPEPPDREVTHLYGVPTWYRRWLPLMQQHPSAFDRIKLMVSGSDGLDRETSDAVFAATGQRILERYGMTETVMICSNPGAGERRAGTVGPPVPGVSVRLVEGEVHVRGPSVFSGYLLGREGIGEDGWFATGDAGAWDEQGYLRIVGRKKDLIIVGGVNVSPAEVEAVFASLPGVGDVGACGVPDADLGEVVGLVLVADPALAPLIEQRAQSLSGLKRPRLVRFAHALPRNALGKLQRAELKRFFV